MRNFLYNKRCSIHNAARISTNPKIAQSMGIQPSSFAESSDYAASAYYATDYSEMRVAVQSSTGAKGVSRLRFTLAARYSHHGNGHNHSHRHFSRCDGRQSFSIEYPLRSGAKRHRRSRLPLCIHLLFQILVLIGVSAHKQIEKQREYRQCGERSEGKNPRG